MPNNVKVEFFSLMVLPPYNLHSSPLLMLMSEAQRDSLAAALPTADRYADPTENEESISKRKNKYHTNEQIRDRYHSHAMSPIWIYG
jgi:hypothetical protein